MDKLTSLSHKLAESLYKSAPPPGGGPSAGPGAGGPSGGEGGPDVVDAEYTVKH
jgi:hypothetical protein